MRCTFSYVDLGPITAETLLTTRSWRCLAGVLSNARGGDRVEDILGETGLSQSGSVL